MVELCPKLTHAIAPSGVRKIDLGKELTSSDCGRSWRVVRLT
jgi:hypothetical protein